MWENSLLTLDLLDSQEGLRTVQIVTSPVLLVEKRLRVNVNKHILILNMNLVFINYFVDI